MKILDAISHWSELDLAVEVKSRKSLYLQEMPSNQ